MMLDDTFNELDELNEQFKKYSSSKKVPLREIKENTPE